MKIIKIPYALTPERHPNQEHPPAIGHNFCWQGWRNEYTD
jgi:hypothetical protein